jgi:hypothetical protein
MQSLCERCAWMREVVTPKGSRFLLCRLSQTDPRFARYPPQPIVRCAGFRPGQASVDRSDTAEDKAPDGSHSSGEGVNG